MRIGPMYLLWRVELSRAVLKIIYAVISRSELLLKLSSVL